LKEYKNRELGFTLIEVLVASTIVFASIGILLQIFSSNLDKMHHSSIVAHRLLIEKLIVASLQDINPSLQSRGKGKVEGVSYQWSARPIVDFKKSNTPFIKDVRVFAVYKVKVLLVGPKYIKYHFDVLLLGWKWDI